VRRDGTGYAFILRNGLSPVIGRPPVIWRDRRAKRMARRATSAARSAQVMPEELDLEPWEMATAAAEPSWPLADTLAPDLPDGVWADSGTEPGRPRRAWDEAGTWS